MPTGLWRALALVFTIAALGMVAMDFATAGLRGNDHVITESVDALSDAQRRVVDVSGTPAENGGLRRGDLIADAAGNEPRVNDGIERPGTSVRWNVERDGRHFVTTTRVTSLEERSIVALVVYNIVRLAMLAVASLLIVRRPDDAAARALVTFLICIAATVLGTMPWLPDGYLNGADVLRYAVQFFGLAQAVHFACIFPFRSDTGFRAGLRRANPWISLAITTLVVLEILTVQRTGSALGPAPIPRIVSFSPLYFFAAITAGFWIAGAVARGADRQRVVWSFGSLGIGFAGPIVQTFCVLFHQNGDWTFWLSFTLVAIPVGLAYTILRHRTIDIGFVVSRALVLTIVSFLIVAAFGLLERALGKIFIDASHIASRTVEIALAIGLGFSLRTLHARVERVVDRLFFRQRQLALASLRDFANDVYHITDADIAVARTIAVVSPAVDAGEVAFYRAAPYGFRRVNAGDPFAFPVEADENDPLFVRLRTARAATALRHLGSTIAAEVAFPMFVRGALAGVLALAPKRSGEAYDPEELALLTELAQRVGIALDTLDTLAMRREWEGRMATFGPRATGGVDSAV
jgi:hypothetical protein